MRVEGEEKMLLMNKTVTSRGVVEGWRPLKASHFTHVRASRKNSRIL